MDLSTVTSMRTPSSRAELALAPGEVFLGGGTYLYSVPQPATTTGLVDLTSLGWKPWKLREDGTLRLGATCTWAQLQRIPADVARGGARLFHEAPRGLLASFKIWSIGTVGGNMCLAYPAGLATVAAIALDAECVIWSPDGTTRRVPAAGFVTGAMTTVLEAGEVLRAIDIPAVALDGRATVRTWASSPTGRAAGVAAVRRDPDGATTFVLAGATTHPYRFRFDGTPDRDELAALLDQVDTWFGDPHGSLRWRRMMAYRVFEELRGQLGEGLAA